MLSHKLSQIYKQYPSSILCLFVVLIETGYDQHKYLIFITSIINHFTLCILENHKIMNYIVFIIIYLMCMIKFWMVSVYARNRKNQYTLYRKRNFINTYTCATSTNHYIHIFIICNKLSMKTYKENTYT